MRKIALFLVIFLLIIGAAFAQIAEGISVGVSAQGIFSPFVYVSDLYANGDIIPDTSYMVAGAGVAWGGPKPAIDLWISGDFAYGGFKIGSSAEGGRKTRMSTFMNASLGDQEASVWIKPFRNDALRLRVGRFEDGVLAGKVGSVNDSFESISLDGAVGGDYIFTGFGTNKYSGGTDFGKNHISFFSKFYDGVGFMVSSEPVKGLFIGLLADGSMFDDQWDGAKAGSSAADVFRYMQVAAGYKIGNVAHIRAQYVGGFMGEYDSKTLQEMEESIRRGDVMEIRGTPSIMLDRPARFELAFAYTGSDLIIDLGLKAHMPIVIKDTDKRSEEIHSFNGFYASIGAQYKPVMMPFGLIARLDAMHIGAYGNKIVFGAAQPTRISEDDKRADPMEFQFRLCPTYDFGVIVGADIGVKYRIAGKDSDGNDLNDPLWASRLDMGFSLFSQVNFPNGYFKLGLTYSPARYLDGLEEGVAVFQIPVGFKLWFW